MAHVLGEAGWDPQLEHPSIDWSTDEAIIIAPRTEPSDRELAFYGLRYSGNETLPPIWMEGT